MTQHLTEPFEPQSYGLGYPQPYPFGIPERLPLNASSNGLEASRVAFTGQGRVLGVSVSSTKTTAQFVQIFDAAAVPATGAIPVVSVDIATVTARGIAFDPYGRWFDRGCVVANSSTQGSLTIGSADCLFDVQYVPQVI